MNKQLTLPIEGLPEETDSYESRLTTALENVLEMACVHYKWWYKHPGADKIIARKSLQIVQDHLNALKDSD